ncbi:hypothetical protein EON64_01590 [archaeon]|nr:MAG: hypothetical protein EON64_01590 [archaeon]
MLFIACAVASKLAELVADLPNHGLPKISKKTGRVLEYPDDWLVDMEGMVDKSVVKDRDSMFDQLQEEDVDIGHRHFSGLHWLFPSTLHSPHFSSAIDSNKSMDNARLFEAADKFMQHKRRHNSGHTSWSASWEAALFARLHNGKQAHDALQRIASKFVTGNLLSIHPPLQNSHISGCITCVVERGWGNAQGFKAQTNTVSTYAEPAEQLLYLPREFETVDRAKVRSPLSKIK